MFRFLQSKKGFTLVELMIVVLLLSLGMVALMNLFLAGWRAFNKSEERFIKQEAVKNAIEYLQVNTDVGAATTAACFATTAVVPNGTTNSDQSNTYLYSEMVDQDSDGTYDGYILKILNAGKPVSEAIQIGTEPLYVNIRPLIGKRTHSNRAEEYLPAAVVTIAALESDFDYGTPENPNVPTADDIYYSLQMTYHFPNMANADGNVGVNNSTKSWTFDTAATYDQTEGHQGSTVQGGMVWSTHRAGDNHITWMETDPTTNMEYQGSLTTNLPAAEAANSTIEKGVVLRVHIDSLIKEGSLTGTPKIPTLCFVATAAYGQDSGEVGKLCDFRDNVLKGTFLGDAFISAYYTVSPPIAKLIAKYPALGATVRALLKPLVVVATYATEPGLLAENAGWLILFGLSGLGASAALVVCDKRLRRERRREKAKPDNG